MPKVGTARILAISGCSQRQDGEGPDHMKEEKFEYDIQRRAKAGTAATFRLVVSAYLIYLAWSILRGVLNGSSPIPVWAGWAAAVFFAAAAVAFAVYTWKIYLRDKEAARLPEESDSEQEDPEP